MNDQTLKRVGLKVTTPRLKILHVLEHAKPSHLSAEAVYQQLKDQGEEVGLATVYRVLTQFESAGLIHRHHFEGDYSVFELADGEHHDHLVCIKCGKVCEFCDEQIELRQELIAKENGFLITDHQHTIYGKCSDCS